MYLMKYILCVAVLSCACGRPSKTKFRADYTYSANNNNYYKLHEEITDWQTAIDTCKSEGAQLFFPENEAEAKEVHSLLNPWSSRNYIWIGVSDLRSNEVYETIDGRALNEVHHQWDVEYEEPDRSTGNHCVVMWNKYELWLKPCEGETVFICKYAPLGVQENDVVQTTPDQLEITQVSTMVIPESTPLGGDKSVLSTEEANGQPRSHVHFGNLIGEELKGFTPKEKLELMVSLLEVIKNYESKAATQCTDRIDEQIDIREPSQ